MSFPQTLEELKTAGYKFEGESNCKGCGANIEWWTTPRGKKMPCDFGSATPHWSTCKNAADFKAEAPEGTSKITSATLNMDWLKKQAMGCSCTVCKKITGR